MINEKTIGEGKKARIVYLVSYTGYNNVEDILVLALMLASTLERKAEIDCENKVVECMLLADAQKVEELVNA